MAAVDTETALARCLRDLPSLFNNNYDAQAARTLRKSLCTSLVRGRVALLFGQLNTEAAGFEWRVSDVQGGRDGAEYTPAARGHACGHIFKPGESSYHCKTCAADDTCVLCARCFQESDHEGHAVFVSISPGNSGCCDCGDPEAWTSPVHCSIHTADAQSSSHGKASLPAGPPQEIVDAMKATVGKALDYVCDVFACSPEQLREEKSVETVTNNEKMSRLNPDKYGGEEPIKEIKYCLMVWNDEKHTLDQVRDQIARACQKQKSFGYERAIEIDQLGRSVVESSTNLPSLLRMAKLLEQIKLSVTIRSSRDTFREQMCETIIDWLSDIHGCSVGKDPNVLREVICGEFFNQWRVGTILPTAEVAQSGIYDHDREDSAWNDYWTRPRLIHVNVPPADVRLARGQTADHDMDDDDDDAVEEDEENEENYNDNDLDTLEEDEDSWNEGRNLVEPTNLIQTARALLQNMAGRGTTGIALGPDPDVDLEMADVGDEDPGEIAEATFAGYLPPPPPSAVRSSLATHQTSLSGSPEDVQQLENESQRARTSSGLPTLPRTPHIRPSRLRARPNQHWLSKPRGWVDPSDWPPKENLKRRLRIDCLMLFDLRLWKTLRDSLRALYISAVITVPEYKRLLGLRFAGLYSLLAQLYLVADREPDHSIVNMSLQLLTTPSITVEVVEKANFFTHLIAIMYTFLTTREVKYPEGVQPNATLSFETGAVTNRRLFHFFIDARYILQAPAVQERLRAEPHFLKQFLDLVKLHQGINPNVRAVGEHVEYETETWVGLAMITKEISRLSRLVADSYSSVDLNDPTNRQQISTALRHVMFETLTSSLGLEWSRFSSCEMKRPQSFRNVGKLGEGQIIIPDVRVLDTELSFQHPLHNLASWMLQSVQSLTREEVQNILSSVLPDILALQAKYPDAALENGPFSRSVMPYDWCSAIFDKPLRMCVWLAQMRAGLWVRNGMNLRHQMHAYRNPTHRDVSYQRDIYMLQAGLVLSDHGSTRIGEKFILQIIYRFDLAQWLIGHFKPPAEYDDGKYLDIVEDLFHLLSSLLTDREDLMATSSFGKPSRRAIQRDAAHALIFKPLSYSELTGRLTERIYDSEAFDEALEEMTVFKPPEGLNDSGTYLLKPEYIETVDPYYYYYSRNQREEADTIYREQAAKRLGIDKSEIVPEPVLPPISDGLFKHLADCVHTDGFVEIILQGLEFAVKGYKELQVDTSRVESVLHIILHLMLIAMREDERGETALSEGFTRKLCHENAQGQSGFSRVQTVLQMGDYSACHPRARLVLIRGQSALPTLFPRAIAVELNTGSSAAPSQGGVDKEAKKKAALERQAQVMAQFKAQQSSFMTNHGLDWDEDMSDEEFADAAESAGNMPLETEKVRDFPADACILCQEEANEERLYGCFACLTPSSIQRQTPQDDPAFVQEVIDTPVNLDRSAENLRPFGVVSHNVMETTTTAADGKQRVQKGHVLSRGFDPYAHVLEDNIITSCGHMMHYSCFETYIIATQRRQAHQISRCHPERMEKMEFLCPLCKALGNMFLPVIWKSRNECYPGILGCATQSFDEWVVSGIFDLMEKTAQGFSVVQAHRETSPDQLKQTMHTKLKLFSKYMTSRVFLGNRTLPFSNPSDELYKAYQLLMGAVYANCRVRDTSPMTDTDIDGQKALAVLIRTIASTVAAVEIQHRGVQSADCLLTAIPEQTLSGLRIFSETVSSMVEMIQLPGTSEAEENANREIRVALGYLTGLTGVSGPFEQIPGQAPVGSNVFWSLSACTMLPAKEWQMHGHNIIQFALLAEVCKVIRLYRQGLGALEPTLKVTADMHEGESQGFSNFCDKLHAISCEISEKSWSPITPWMSKVLLRIVERQALIFLRKVAILMHVRCAVDFSAISSGIDPTEPELDRLCTMLRLPSLSSMFASLLQDNPVSKSLRSRIQSLYKRAIPHENLMGAASLDHPGIFELVGLPQTFDALTELAVRSKCPTTGRDVTDPVVCLFCGAIFCSQGSCCRLQKNEAGIGGANQHMATCGGSVGLFLNIRKCMVLFLHDGRGCFAPAPYLDRHGEADPTLRRHQQLFLNRRRYDKLLRDVWLAHGIPSVVSRKLEGDISNGGWETL